MKEHIIDLTIPVINKINKDLKLKHITQKKKNTKHTHIHTKSKPKTFEELYQNIDQYIYSSKFEHVYLYGKITSSNILEVINSINNANSSKNKKKDTDNNTQKTQQEPSPLNTTNDTNKSNEKTKKTKNKKKKEHKKIGIVLHINSQGGFMIDGLSLIRIISESKLPIISYTEGLCASAATYIALSCKYRVMGPYSSFMIHQLTDTHNGQKDSLEFQYKITNMLHENMLQIYKNKTNIPDILINKLLNYDLHLTPDKSIEYGLVDKILPPHQHNKKIIYYPYSTHKFYIRYSNNNSIFDSQDETKNIEDDVFNLINSSDITTSKNIIQSLINTHITILHISNFDKQNLSIINILYMINICAVSKTPIISILDTITYGYGVLISVVATKRLMYKTSFVAIDFVSMKKYNYNKIGSSIYSYQTDVHIITHIFKNHTKLPANILENIFDERFIFNSQECLKYGIVDQILD